MLLAAAAMPPSGECETVVSLSVAVQLANATSEVFQAHSSSRPVLPGWLCSLWPAAVPSNTHELRAAAGLCASNARLPREAPADRQPESVQLERRRAPPPMLQRKQDAASADEMFARLAREHAKERLSAPSASAPPLLATSTNDPCSMAQSDASSPSAELQASAIMSAHRVVLTACTTSRRTATLPSVHCTIDVHLTLSTRTSSSRTSLSAHNRRVGREALLPVPPAPPSPPSPPSPRNSHPTNEALAERSAHTSEECEGRSAGRAKHTFSTTTRPLTHTTLCCVCCVGGRRGAMLTLAMALATELTSRLAKLHWVSMVLEVRMRRREAQSAMRCWRAWGTVRQGASTFPHCRPSAPPLPGCVDTTMVLCW
ncbi:uncharacterized protein MONOS_16451c2 [Monocercomonoides exilis]|uniref:uncharacterized protein n=1 Tax=Monocercomonoides exilis TaxID=2049356 RepID=UPI003559B209|nr:hypothetical protein MONOS_16451c1 [Monocercomonoides exilis]KAH7816743.1 hypothetical protein MONOS_16451c2 [Monocercomonoides exilis]|eukprot:MONOS_16451.1-p1 / transcript=MONOS_16451.1 / gene=MONOS_16451 / organism=Monocercomonoides_exilis_PA203 / gene_product=unspecified product / transcript_product=unspecified product / location=Mono_scaffold01750:235-1347(+) / protein_length=371 / sequence_SO=supercontig / SO=protein_coding / is_pseudo=false